MNVTAKLFSVLMLLSISLSGCKATQVPQEEKTERLASEKSNLIYLSSDDQLAQLVSQGNVFVDFYSDGCGPCKQLGTVLHELAAEFPEVTFVKVNVASFGRLSNQYGVRSIPALFFFKDGARVSSQIGFGGGKPVLVAAIKQAFSL